MMQPTDLWDLDHAAERGKLNGPTGRRIFIKGQVGPRAIVVFEILLQDTAQTSLVEGNNVVEAFAPN